MTTAPPTESVSRRIRTTVDELGFDLVVVSVGSIVALTALQASGVETRWIRVGLGLPFVLLFPGYALVSALFPRRPTPAARDPERAYSPATAERIALSFGCSLALVPVLAVAHGLLDVPFETGTVLSSVTVTIVGFSVVAAGRRQALSPGERYDPPSLVRTGRGVGDWLVADHAGNTLLNVVLVASVLLAVSAFGATVVAPSQGEDYTSVSLVTETGSGDFVASNYTTNLTTGETATLTLRVANHYETRENYTAVAELQRVERPGNGSVVATERERLHTASAQISANDTWRNTHSIAPSMTGTDLRLVYAVYRGEAPATADAERADATAHLWVTVQPA